MLDLCSHGPKGGTGLWWQICLELLQQEPGSIGGGAGGREPGLGSARRPHGGPGAHCAEAVGGGALDAVRGSAGGAATPRRRLCPKTSPSRKA